MSAVLRMTNTRSELESDWAPISTDALLPVSFSKVEMWLGRLYPRAVAGLPRLEVLREFCVELAAALKLPLAVLGRRLDTGGVAIEAASADNSLWVELQHVPERWDGGVAGNGPAGTALRVNAPLRMSVDRDHFMIWRAAAEREKVREVLAWPFKAAGADYVLELFCPADLLQNHAPDRVPFRTLLQALSMLLEDVWRIGEERLVARSLESAGNAAFITDLEGTIVWSNRAFSALSRYARQEVVGRNPNLLRSGQQGVRYYRELWSTIRAGNVWSGETVDRNKDGQIYTIHQTVSPIGQDGQITHYISIHQDIGPQKRRQAKLELNSATDPQSGLLTRAAFDSAAKEALTAARTNKGRCALVIVSLRGLKRAGAALNEELDEFLAATMGQRIQQSMAPPDLAGILGRHEYGLLWRGAQLDPASVEHLLERLGEALDEPVPYLGDTVNPEPHFGTAYFPDDAESFDELLLKADRNLADEPYTRARRKTKEE